MECWVQKLLRATVPVAILLKLIAPNEPLSLQVHPSLAKPKKGFPMKRLPGSASKIHGGVFQIATISQKWCMP